MTVYYLHTKEGKPILNKDGKPCLFSSFSAAEIYRDIVLFDINYVILGEVDLNPEIDETPFIKWYESEDSIENSEK